MILANIVVALICLVLQRHIVKLGQVRASVIASNSYNDLIAFAVFGALGLFMKAYDWPRVPLLIGMVLGQLAEANFFISVQVYGASWLGQRPIVLATLGLTLAFLAAMVLRGRRDRAMRAQQAGGGDA